MKKFYDKTVLVTGASGFLGRHLVQALSQNSSCLVVGLARTPRPDFIPDQVAWLQTDLANPAKNELIRGYNPDLIFHLVAEIDPSIHRPMEHYYEKNFYSALHFLDDLVGMNLQPKHVIMVGSSAEYGSAPCPQDPEGRELPVSPYGAAKLAQTKMAQVWGVVNEIPVTTVRSYTIYGQGMSEKTFLGSVLKAAREGKELKVTNCKQTRDFVLVDHVVKDLLKVALDSAFSGRVVNSCTGHGFMLMEIINFLLRSYPGFQPQIGALPQRNSDIIHSYGVPLTPQPREQAWNDLTEFLKTSHVEPELPATRWSLRHPLKKTDPVSV